jgi:hypothetical protein
MTPRNIVQEFYEPNVLLQPDRVAQLLHPEVILDWRSSTGHSQLNYDALLKISQSLGAAYLQFRCPIDQILVDKNEVSVRYVNYAKTIENKHEEHVLGYFMVQWEIRDGLLYRGFQISQPAI